MWPCEDGTLQQGRGRMPCRAHSSHPSSLVPSPTRLRNCPTAWPLQKEIRDLTGMQCATCERKQRMTTKDQGRRIQTNLLRETRGDQSSTHARCRAPISHKGAQQVYRSAGAVSFASHLLELRLPCHFLEYLKSRSDELQLVTYPDCTEVLMGLCGVA